MIVLPPEVWVPAAMAGGLGLACSAALGAAARFFAVTEDPRVEQLAALLPGVNCGACGQAGCVEYAKQMAFEGAAPNLCKPGGPETAAKLAAALGVEVVAQERNVALVLCGGDDSLAHRQFAYNGVADCAAAAAVWGGDKACGYGCLGLGTCARVCPASAIEITPGRLAVVHPELCIGCGLCVKACPRKIIRLVPESRTIHVLCSSKDRGPVVKKKCKVGCIGCSLCVKKAGGDAIRMDGPLAVINYAAPLDNPDVPAVCPQRCIVVRSGGKPQAQP